MTNTGLGVGVFSGFVKAVTKSKSGVAADVIDAIDDSFSHRLWEDGAAQTFRLVPSWLDFNWTDKIAIQRDSRQSGQIQTEQTNSNNSSLFATFPGGSYSTLKGFDNIKGDLVTGVVYSVPDNGLAIAPNGYIVSVVNDTIGWTANFTTLMQFKAFSQFFPALLVGNMSFTDPQVLYDSRSRKIYSN